MSEHPIFHSLPPGPTTAASFGEQLSALMDGELARDQVRFLLRGIEVQSDLSRRWSNYRLIGASLRREFVALELPADFSAGVIARLDAGTAAAAAAPPARRIGFGTLRWLGGGAIAAAVAVVALTISRPAVENAAAPALAFAERPAAPRAATQAYLPLARPLPNTNSPVFTGNAVQPVSFERLPLPGYSYPPNGIGAIANPAEAYRAPLRAPAPAGEETPARQ